MSLIKWLVEDLDPYIMWTDKSKNIFKSKTKTPIKKNHLFLFRLIFVKFCIWAGKVLLLRSGTFSIEVDEGIIV